MSWFGWWGVVKVRSCWGLRTWNKKSSRVTSLQRVSDVMRGGGANHPVAVAVAVPVAHADAARTEEMCSRLPANQRQTMYEVDRECDPNANQVLGEDAASSEQRAATDAASPRPTRKRPWHFVRRR
jgi:hypothetical protein